MKALNQRDLKELYEIDDHLWLEKTIQLLQEKKFQELDIEHLIEELEYLSRKDKAAVKSFLEQIIRHLLLLQFWLEEYEYNANHWQAEVVNFRSQLKYRLTTNLRNHLRAELDSIYKNAVNYVQKKTGLDLFPEKCPYSLEELLDDNWFPSFN